MTNEELQQLIKIREGAPEGATHKGDIAWYKRQGTAWYLYSYVINGYREGWVECGHSVELCDLRALSDINTIIEQQERIKELNEWQRRINAAINELDSDSDDCKYNAIEILTGNYHKQQ